MSKFVRASIPFLLLFLSDQLIKYFVISQDLNYYKNYGFLFGLVNFNSPHISFLVISTTLIIIIALQAWGLRDPRSIPDLARLAAKRAGMTTEKRLSWSLFLAGSVSNFLDRMTRGYVADYLDWKTVMPFWPENFVRFFNLADVMIVLGLLMAIVVRFGSDMQPRSH